MEHLFSCAVEAFHECPQLSRVYVQEFRDRCESQEIEIGEYNKYFCASCCTIFIPEVTSTIATKKVGKKKKKKPNLVIKCLHCNAIKTIPILVSTARKQIKEKEKKKKSRNKERSAKLKKQKSKSSSRVDARTKNMNFFGGNTKKAQASKKQDLMTLFDKFKKK